jgi:hypothetical protein
MNPEFSSFDDFGRIAREGDGKTQGGYQCVPVLLGTILQPAPPVPPARTTQAASSKKAAGSSAAGAASKKKHAGE